MKANWKTTTLGILMILGALCNAAAQWIQGKQVDLATLGMAITGGMAAIKAADAKPAP